MATNLVTVAAVTNSAEAQFVVNRLQEGGIEAAIADDNVVSMDFLFGNAVGWIKVQVREQDAKLAEEILAVGEPPVDEAEIPWEQPPDEDEDEDEDEKEATPGERARKVAERTAPVENDPALAETEQLVTRAYRQAIVGLFLFPPLMNLHSLYLLRRVGAEESAKLSDANLRRSSIAFLTNFCSILTFGWIWIAGIFYAIRSVLGI
jgi:Putative prokaryotic signal transducing protein